MSFVRLAARPVLANARRYSTAPASAPKSNLPLFLAGGGVVAVAGYFYLNGSSQPAALAKPKISDKSALDPQNFVDFKLKAVEPYNHNTAKFVFELPPDTATLLPVAACVVVKSSADSPKPLLDGKGKPVIRPYTPISPSDHPGELTFLVKKYDTGVMSKYFFDLKPGESLSVKGPISKIPVKANQFEQVGMIAGGSGITPMYQILDHVLQDPENKTKFTLIFANVAERDIIMKQDFDTLQKKYPSTLNVVYTLDKPEADWKGETGYVNADMITKHLPSAKLGEKTKIFVCGPPGQVAALAGKKDGMKQGELAGTLKELGYSSDQVFKF
ncbi:ferredoxin reductase-like C-terminal NADP-linked domain-containing protein [Epithele typhae]|uniref:ferredoxin reductase-like C-terminal NADP-linked domain-containing protein n=1 Tax=Epithele typhae TaxID=378194 RepID=UPI0020088278|nr:ferredoxin reductase-like C-terminal NADP-linked domain-containing protein [Epithele typhae]KAH9905530.1 ferredoxin reductase-like C-terminal NADP-linked domain-containing protein [Epithele typhae]